MRSLDALERGKRASAGGDLNSVAIEQSVAQRLGETRAAVVGGAAADSDDDAPGARIESRAQQLTGTERRRSQRISAVRGHQHQAGGLRHLDDGRVAIAEEAVTCGEALAERPGDRELANPSAGGGDQRIDGSLAAVGHRNLIKGRSGSRSRNAESDRRGGFGGRQAALEFVRRDDHSHARDSSDAKASGGREPPDLPRSAISPVMTHEVGDRAAIAHGTMPPR